MAYRGFVRNWPHGQFGVMMEFEGQPPYLLNPERISVADLMDCCQAFRVDMTLSDIALEFHRALSKTENQIISLDQLMEERGQGGSTIRRRLKQLVEAGVLLARREPVMRPSGKRKRVAVYEYRIPSGSEIQEHLRETDQAVKRLSQRQHIVSGAEPGPLTSTAKDTDHGLASYINKMWSIAFPVLSYSRQDTSESRTVSVSIGNAAPFPITATSHHGTPLARVTDLMAWCAILALCLEDMRYRWRTGGEITNRFSIKGADLSRKMGLSRVDYVIDVLRRLNNTQVNVNKVPQVFLDNWGLEHADISTGFIHELAMGKVSASNEKQEPDSKSNIQWVFQWQIPDSVFQLLLKKINEPGEAISLFRLSSDLVKQKNNVVLALHLFCRRIIRDHSNKPEMSLKELHAEIAPALPRHDFFEMLGVGIRSLHERESQRYDDGTALRITTKLSDNEDGLDVLPMKPPSIEGEGGSPVSTSLPEKANVECYGFVIVIDGDKVQMWKNEGDPILGLASRSTQRQLKQKSHRPTQNSLFPDDEGFLDF